MSQLDHLFISEIKGKIQDNETEEVIEILLEFAQNIVPTSDFNDLSVISASWRRNAKNMALRKITKETGDVEANNINSSLLWWLDNVYETTQRKVVFNRNFTSKVEVTSPVNININLEKLIGSSDLQPVAWFQMGMAASSAVCYVNLPNDSGTGFMLKNGYLLTNHHVIPSKTEASLATLQFDYQKDKNGQFNTLYRYKLEPDTLITNEALDYAIVKVQPVSLEDNKPLNDWGAVSLISTPPEKDAYLVIIQHPLGQPKQLAFDRIADIVGAYALYTVDTQKGSSGSPVFDMNWNVVALHHAEKKKAPVNEGILISKILEDLPEDLRKKIV